MKDAYIFTYHKQNYKAMHMDYKSSINSRNKEERRKGLQRREKTEIKDMCEGTLHIQQGSEKVWLEKVLIWKHHYHG